MNAVPAAPVLYASWLLIVFLVLAGVLLVAVLRRSSAARDVAAGIALLALLAFGLLFSFRAASRDASGRQGARHAREVRGVVEQRGRRHRQAITPESGTARAPVEGVVVSTSRMSSAGDLEAASTAVASREPRGPGGRHPAASPELNRSEPLADSSGPAEVKPASGPLPALDSERPSLVAPDDRADWERSAELGFEPAGTRPSWVASGGGSRRALESFPELQLVYWAPAPDGTLVGYSDIEVTREDALRGARESAARKLAWLALREARRRDSAFPARDLAPAAIHLARDSGDWRESGQAVETAHRSFDRTYVRAAVRIDASQERIARLTERLLQLSREGFLARQERYRRIFVIVAGALLCGFVVFLLLSLLNARTKGWFAWPIRLVSLTLLAAIAVAAYHLITRFATKIDLLG